MVVLISKDVIGRHTWPQWIAGLQVCILSIVIGMIQGWTSPYLAKLTKDDSPLYITTDEASWVASLLNVGRPIGAISGALIVSYLGSKKALMFTGLFPALGWIFIIAADSVYWLYASRVLAGIGTGMMFTCFPLYLGEIANPNIRGAMVTFVINGMPIGVLIGNSMGPFMSMTKFAYISLVPNLLFLAFFFILPESPHYLVGQRRIQEAKKSIRWYHHGEDVIKELDSIQNFVKESNAMTFMEKMMEIGKTKNRKALLMLIVLFFFLQASGINFILFYMEIIVTNAGVTVILPAMLVVVINTIRFIVGWVAMFFIDKYGRRKLLALSSASVCVSHILLGTHFMLLYFNYDASQLQWLPMISLLMFTLVCIGLVPVPNTMVSEMLPSHLRSVAGCIASISSAVFAFMASKSYQPMVDVAGEQYVFFINATLMVASIIYSLYGVPETQGKTLQEIQDMLDAS